MGLSAFLRPGTGRVRRDVIHPDPTEAQHPGGKSEGSAMENPEIVIIGAGISGGAVGTALARRGISVLLLEKSLVHQDRVRGEFLVPWGVNEAERLGVLDVLLGAGGHYIRRSIPYGEAIAPDAARAGALELGGLLPGISGALGFSHPRACQAFDDAALMAGAALLRGVGDITVAAGAPPEVAFTHEGREYRLSPRLVVGADGRGSAVARQIGAHVGRDPDHHLLAGMLIEGAEVWPDEEYTIGTDGDVVYFIFPQGGGRVRLYAGYALDQADRFAGPDGARRFLDAFRLPSLPQGDALACARPAGPCRGAPNADTWVDRPVAPGVVLIGDAAGYSDPTSGQGLSIALRDARLVSEAYLDVNACTAETFACYVAERRERMHRIRFTTKHYSHLRAEFTAEARARRRRAAERTAADRTFALPILSLLKGPFGVPDQAFSEEAWSRLLH
jgi:2-polyprenyl-6-methoxyphenol hydroxylase-like FAD-dependent oxidoreductase